MERRFRDRLSYVMERILVLMHSQWWDKVNTQYMEYVVYFCFKIFFAYFAFQQYLKHHNHRVDKLMIEENDFV